VPCDKPPSARTWGYSVPNGEPAYMSGQVYAGRGANEGSPECLPTRGAKCSI
jgi:hypothetical protein